MSFSKTFKIQSAGAAYNLDMGFVPNRIEVVNYTKWETDGSKVEFKWFQGMTTDYALSALCEDSSSNHAIETSNGFTVSTGASFTSNRGTISAITAANPAVVTATTHGYGDAGDEITIRIRDIVGMTELNGNLYRALIVDANRFSLKDLDGNSLDATGYTAWSSSGFTYDISSTTEDSGGYVTLGSTVMGANDDILYVTAFIDDMRVDVGDVA